MKTPVWLKFNSSDTLLNQELQLIPASERESTEQGQSFSKLGQRLLKWLTSPSEPKICQISSGQGQLWWRVDDPETGECFDLDSEDEVRIWLDMH